MKVTVLLLVVVALLSLFGASQTLGQEAEDASCEAVYLVDGWARASVEGAPNSAAYGILVNLSGEDDTLIAASTDAAEFTELHEMVMGAGDVMQMRPVEGGIAVPATGFAQLKPGGLHIMLINLAEPLVAGEMLTLTLTFEVAGELEVSLPIKVPMEMGAQSMSGGGMMQDAPMEAASLPTVEWTEECAGIHVLGAWARPAGPAMPTSAAYALVVNLTDTADTLVSASAPIAGSTEIHEMVMGDKDVMRMRPVEGGIEIPSGSAAILAPGGLHIMLISLTDEFAEGSSFELTLSFEEHEDILITVPIQMPAEMMEGSM